MDRTCVKMMSLHWAVSCVFLFLCLWSGVWCECPFTKRWWWLARLLMPMYYSPIWYLFRLFFCFFTSIVFGNAICQADMSALLTEHFVKGVSICWTLWNTFYLIIIRPFWVPDFFFLFLSLHCCHCKWAVSMSITVIKLNCFSRCTPSCVWSGNKMKRKCRCTDTLIQQHLGRFQ